MAKRLEKKGLGKPPFTKDELRADALSVFNGHEDGAAECRYCHGFYTLVEIAIDHAVPLSRGGALGLENLDYPCSNCNNAKGSLTPAEFSKLVQFLEREIPLGRKDVLGRLAKAVSLAQGMRSNAPIIKELRSQVTGATSRRLARYGARLRKPF